MDVYTLASATLRARIIPYGARLVSLEAPDRRGLRENVVLGYATLAEYEASDTYFGATIGRFANRIAGGRYTLDGAAYAVPRNNGPNALHGGPAGFDRATWTVESAAADAIVLRHISPDGDQGFPGTLSVRVRYALAGDALRITYEARTDRATIVSLTNHTYFNLCGDRPGDVLDHVVTLSADRYTPIDADGLPTGEIRSVDGTPFDLRTPVRLRDRIRSADEQMRNGRGFDHNWMLAPRGNGDPVTCAEVVEPESGRRLTCATTEPGLQLYTGNVLSGRDVAPDGARTYRQSDGLTLETQAIPNAPNVPAFPSAVLRPHETLRSSTVYRFGAV